MCQALGPLRSGSGHCLCSSFQLLLGNYSSQTHVSACALTCPLEPHTVPLTTACRCLKSTCLKPNSVSCILFPHQVCLHHSHSMLNLFVFVFLTREFQGQILWLEHIGPGLKAVTNQLQSNLKQINPWESLFLPLKCNETAFLNNSFGGRPLQKWI